MAAEMVKSATSDKLLIMDWTKNIEICELVAKDQGQAKDVIKCIKKRLGHRSGNTQLFTIRLLEMLIYNCGEHIHQQLIDNGLLPILVKIVKKKTNLPVRERIFLLLDATQTSLGGAKGKFPQYYAAYYDLVASRVQFPQCNHIKFTHSSQAKEKNEHSEVLPEEVSKSNRFQAAAKQPSSESISDHSIIYKATSVLEILRDALNALASKCPEGAADEFILDLVEQCSFQKQRVMQLAMTCHDEKVIAEAIELNDLLNKVLAQHDALLSVRAPSTAEDAAAEDEENLLLRMCKGKALAEDDSDFMRTSFFRPISDGDARRSLIRPLCIQPTAQEDGVLLTPSPPAPVSPIPPPPNKQVERERFFKEKHSGGNCGGPAGHIRGLSVRSCPGSSSRSCSTDFSSDASNFYDRLL